MACFCFLIWLNVAIEGQFFFLLLELVNHLHMVLCSQKSLRDHLSTLSMYYFHEKILFNMQEMSDHLYDGNLIIILVRVSGGMCFLFIVKASFYGLRRFSAVPVHLRNWFSPLYYNYVWTASMTIQVTGTLHRQVIRRRKNTSCL